MSVETTEAPVVETAPVAEKPAKVVKAPAKCACSLYTGQDAKGVDLSTGCTAETVRTFGPGHDAKLKSLLIKVAIAGGEVTKTVNGESSQLSAIHAAEEYGFRPQVEKGLAVHTAKVTKSTDAAAARAAKKAEKDAAKAEAKAKREADKAAKKAQADALQAATDKANADKVAGPATAKVGSQKYDGEILADGTFRYTNATGEQVETEKYTIVIDPSTVVVPTVAAN